MIFLDTHVLVWLFSGEREYFSSQAQEMLLAEDLVIAPIVLLELQYLYEAQKISKPGEVIYASLQQNIGLRMVDCASEKTIRAAIPLLWTRDPFDRIIVAHAFAYKAKLLTKDRNILQNYAGAVW